MSGLSQISSNISPLNVNNSFVDSNNDKAENLNNYFAFQTFLIDDNKPVPGTLIMDHDKLERVRITKEDV